MCIVAMPSSGLVLLVCGSPLLLLMAVGFLLELGLAQVVACHAPCMGDRGCWQRELCSSPDILAGLGLAVIRVIFMLPLYFPVTMWHPAQRSARSTH